MPRNGIRATLMLCDYVSVVEGKFNIIGGGWNVIGPTRPYGIALYLEIPWDRANMKHRVTLELLDADGKTVVFDTVDGEKKPYQPSNDIECGRPPGMKPGSPLSASLGYMIPPLPMPPGQQFVWQLSIDGHADEDWRLTFSTRPAPPEALAA